VEEEMQVMKQARRVSLLLLAILLPLLQEQQPASVCRLATKYDSLADTTTIQCDDLVKFGEAPSGLSVRADASFRGKEQDQGKEPAETSKFWLFLSSNRSGATRRTQPLFQEATTLYLLVDSARLEIAVKDYRHEFYELTSSFSESARAEIGHEGLRKLLAAKSLKGKWGSAEFRFSNDALASLKGFISSRVFAAHTRIKQ
jgi:hypothetical protein